KRWRDGRGPRPSPELGLARRSHPGRILREPPGKFKARREPRALDRDARKRRARGGVPICLTRRRDPSMVRLVSTESDRGGARESAALERWAKETRMNARKRFVRIMKQYTIVLVSALVLFSIAAGCDASRRTSSSHAVTTPGDPASKGI